MYARKLDRRMQLKDHYTPHNGPLIRIRSQFMTNFNANGPRGHVTFKDELWITDLLVVRHIRPG